MIRVREVKVKVEDKDKLNKKIANKLDTKVDNIKSFKILKESIDARYKPDLYYIYEVDIALKNERDILKRNKSNDVLDKICIVREREFPEKDLLVKELDDSLQNSLDSIDEIVRSNDENTKRVEINQRCLVTYLV